MFFYLPACVFAKNREQAFQRLNTQFFNIFLRLVRLFFPMHEWHIDADVAAIQGEVIVCNHRSYLDPLILISLFSRQKTIVKTRFFSFPVFGWLLRVSGYLPATTQGRFAGMMIERMETMASFLEEGGVVFIFPEGTRNRDERLAGLQPGAFKIARLCRASVSVVRICNSEKLFPPGSGIFSGSSSEPLSITLAGSIKADSRGELPAAEKLATLVCSLLSKPDSASDMADENYQVRP